MLIDTAVLLVFHLNVIDPEAVAAAGAEAGTGYWLLSNSYLAVREGSHCCGSCVVC